MIRSNSYSIVVLILAGLLLGAWYFLREHFEDLPGEIVKSNNPDYSIGNFHSRVFSESGELEYEMKSSTLNHYPQDDSIQMKKLWVQLYKGDGAPWVIQSDKGELPSNDLMILSGNVNIDGLFTDKPAALPTPDSPPLLSTETSTKTSAPIKNNDKIKQKQRQHINMKTETLILEIKNEIASTSDFVTISTEMDIIESTGLEVDLRKDTFILQNNVKGTYNIE